MALSAVEITRWSVSALAREFGLDRRTVTERIRAANIHPIGTDRGNPVYAMADAARACFAVEALHTGGGDDLDPERLPPKERKDWYEGERLRITLEQQRKQLVTLDEYQDEMSRVLKDIAMTLETLPDVLERKCALSPDAVLTMQQLLDEQRTALADRIDAAWPHPYQPPPGGFLLPEINADG